MKLSDFYYDLPKELIAQDPLTDRASSRLMVLNKETGEIRHDVFRNIVNYLKPTDCLVINDTKVIPARLYGTRIDTGAVIEILLLERQSDTDWECLVKPGKKARTGCRLRFGNEKPSTDDPGLDNISTKDFEMTDGIIEETINEARQSNDGRIYEQNKNCTLTGEIIDVLPDGNRIIRFSFDGIFEEILDRLGQMPLPPYITHKLKDKTRYQTVYAKYDGSAAAPTAGLHFTKELLQEINNMGVKIAHVTLHVGLGTFRPVKEENILDHKMHSELCMITQENADLINQTKASGGRIICVGTTSTRTLETMADDNGVVSPGICRTEIFIYPGYHFKITDCLITNFHLPESTLLMLVSALSSREMILQAYEEAVQERYRFFSFGDAMFIIDTL